MDSPNVMIRVRRLARAAVLATVTIGCADHAINLVSRDCASVEPFSEALRDGTRVAVFMRRCGRARTAMAGAVKRAVQWVGALRFYHGEGASRKGAA